MADPVQPGFPTLPSALAQGAQAAVPTLATSMPWMTHQYPGMPTPGASPYQSPQAGYTNFEIMQLTSGHPTMQSQGNIGFAGRQMIPFTPGDTIGSMAMNWAANMGLGLLAQQSQGGSSFDMIPFQGLNGMSRFDYFQSRQRQGVADLMFSGTENVQSVYASNPNLQFGDLQGIARNPLFQQVMAMDGYKTAFLTAHGQLGTTFGGDLMSQGVAANQFMSAIAGGMGREGGGWDRGLMQGLGATDLVSGIAAANNMGVLGVTGSDLKSIVNAVASGDSAGANAMARELGSGVASVVASGRDVFGQDASAYDVFAGIESVFGKEGLTDSSTASARLREIEAAGQVLNMDARTVASYMRLMKQVSENAGLVGSSSTSASMSAILAAEGAVQFGSSVGVNVDKGVVSNRQNEQFTRSALSGDAKEKTVLANILGGTSRDVLTEMTLNVGGTAMSGAAVHDKIQAGLAKMEAGEMSPAERQQFEKFMADAGKSFNSSSDPRVRAMGADMVERLAFFDAKQEERTAQGYGIRSYNSASRASGITHGALNAVEKAIAKSEADMMSGTGSDRDILEAKGGVRGFLDEAGKAGVFSALESGGVEAMMKQLGVMAAKDADAMGLTGAAREEYIRTQSAAMSGTVNNLVRGAVRYSGETGDDTIGMFAAMEQAAHGQGARQQVAKDLDEAEKARQVFNTLAGGNFGSKSLGKRAIDLGIGVLRNSGKGYDVKTLISKALNDGVGASSIDAMTKIASGEMGYTDEDGSKRTINDLYETISAIEASGGSTEEVAQKVQAATDDFYDRTMAENGDVANALSQQVAHDQSEAVAQDANHVRAESEAAVDGASVPKPADAMAKGRADTGTPDAIVAKLEEIRTLMEDITTRAMAAIVGAPAKE